MKDLPVLLGEPTGRRRQSPLAVAWPWWMAPARLVGRVRPQVLAAAAADAEWLRGLPPLLVAVVPPLLVIALAGIVSATHATSLLAHPSLNIDWLRLLIDDVFTESPPFLLGAIAIGVFSPALGVLFVAVFGVMDLAAATMQHGELQPLPDALIGRLIAIWLLWLLAVEVPTFGRLLGLSWQRLAGNRFAVAALTALATAGFVWIWTQATIVLITPVFTWSSLPAGITDQAIQPVQSAGLVFAAFGGLLAAAVALTRGPAGLISNKGAPLPAFAPSGRLPLVREVIGRIAVAALLTVSLAGLISIWLEAVALFAVLLGARPLARLVADRTPLGAIVAMVPPIVRFAAVVPLTFVVSLLTISPLYTLATFDSTGKVPQFFSVILAVAIGIVLVEFATTPATPGRPRVAAASSALVAVMLVSGLALLTLAAPGAVAANNCTGLGDCFGSPFFAALAAGGVPLLLAALFAKGGWEAFKAAMSSYRAAKYAAYEEAAKGGGTPPVLGVRG